MVVHLDFPFHAQQKRKETRLEKQGISGLAHSKEMWLYVDK